MGGLLRPLLAGALLLGGCALPLPVRIAGWAIDGVSYLATKKSVSDHGISLVAGRDCAMLRVVTKGAMCDAEPATGPILVDAGSSATSSEIAAAPETTIAALAAPVPASPSSGLPDELRRLRDGNLGMFRARWTPTNSNAAAAEATRPVISVAAVETRPPQEAGAGLPRPGLAAVFETAARAAGAASTAAAPVDLPEGPGLLALWQTGSAPKPSAETVVTAAPAPNTITVAMADSQVPKSETLAALQAMWDLPEGPRLVAMWGVDRLAAAPAAETPVAEAPAIAAQPVETVAAWRQVDFARIDRRAVPGTRLRPNGISTSRDGTAKILPPLPRELPFRIPKYHARQGHADRAVTGASALLPSGPPAPLSAGAAIARFGLVPVGGRSPPPKPAPVRPGA